MPPVGQTKPAVVPRLSDRVAIGALTQTYPPELVDQVLAQTGRRERRYRLLPARMVVYYLLAMCLFADIAYVEVLRLLVEALRRPGRRRPAVGDHGHPGGVVPRLAAGGHRRDLPGRGRHARQPGLVRPATQRPG